MLMFIALSILFILLFLLFYSFVDVLSQLRMFLRVSKEKGYGPCGPISSLHPWENWVPPDLHGFYRWVFDSLEVLNGFVRQVVISRRDEGIRRWNRWLREDLSSRPYAWLRPDFVPPSPFLCN